MAVDTSGNVSVDGYVAAPAYRSFTVGLDDDVAVELRALYPAIPPYGIIQVSSRNYAKTSGSANYRAASSPFCSTIANSDDLAFGTAALTNGTSNGTDEKLNIAATSSGELFIKNRRGATITVVVTIFG